jgi:hypothetical protein
LDWELVSATASPVTVGLQVGAVGDLRKASEPLFIERVAL